MTSADQNGIAIFDIGSNAVRLTAHRFSGDHTEQFIKDVSLCEMGRDLARTGVLHPAGVTCAMTAIRRYMRLIREPAHACTHLVATATDAIRRAQDGAAFIAAVHDNFGIQVRILSEEDEGLFGARGVLRDLPSASGIVADLGGGSLQLTRVDAGQVGPTHSMALGALRMLAETDRLDAYIDAQLATLPDSLRDAETVYVIGGSWRSLTKLYLMRAHLPAKDVQGVELSPDRVAAIAQNLWGDPAALPASVLMSDYGMEKSRAELMPYAALLLARLCDLLSVERLVVSTAGVRDGVVQGLIDGTITPDPLPPAK